MKALKTIGIALAITCVIVMLGLAGASDNNTIETKPLLIWLLIDLVVFFVALMMINMG